MKTTLVAMSLLAAAGCASNKEFQQVDMVAAKVVKIDTLYRYPEYVKQLTWKDIDDIEYISYVSIHNEIYSVGYSMLVMRRR